MDNIIISKSELELKRNLKEAKRYIDDVLIKVQSLNDDKKQYRVSKGLYKKFREEYIPLFNYLVFKYGYDNDVVFKYVGIGNQEYDAIIEINGRPIKVEITYLILGADANKRNKEVNTTGYSLRINKPQEVISKIREQILETAIKKSSKFYGDTLLILYFPCEDMYPGDYLLRTEILENIIEDLKKINYKAKRVEFFIHGKLVCNYLGENELLPQNYIIKNDST